MTVKWNDQVIREVTTGPEVQRELLNVGNDVAEVAAGLAPKDTGGGARSIRADAVTVGGVPEVRVSWDRDHYYLAFFEFGSEHQRAQPFLRPAAARFA